jgi:hypothetical protein
MAAEFLPFQMPGGQTHGLVAVAKKPRDGRFRAFAKLRGGFAPFGFCHRVCHRIDPNVPERVSTDWTTVEET